MHVLIAASSTCRLCNLYVLSCLLSLVSIRLERDRRVQLGLYERFAFVSEASTAT